MTRIAVGELQEWLTQRLTIESSGSTVVHAGHFVLDSAGEAADDHLAERDCELPASLRDFVEFTRFTWTIACQAVVAAGSHAELMALVNDWQFVRIAADKRTRERIAHGVRRDYYARVPALPSFHLEVLHEHGLTTDRIVKYAPGQWLFSESDLRRHLPRSLRALEQAGLAAARGVRTDITATNGPTVTVASAVRGETCLLYCGNTNCSGEVIQLLKELNDRGVKRLVNLYPIQCIHPVSVGTELASELFDLSGIEVVNIAIPFDRWQRQGGQSVVIEVVEL